MMPEVKPLVKTLASETVMATATDHTADIPDPMINSTSLKKQDWRKGQSSDPNLSFVLDRLTECYKQSNQGAIQRQLASDISVSGRVSIKGLSII